MTLAGDVLTIKGEKKAEHEQRQGDRYYMERRFGSFSRLVRLPFEVKDEKVDATYDKGVLTLRVPKRADAQRTVHRSRSSRREQEAQSSGHYAEARADPVASQHDGADPARYASR